MTVSTTARKQQFTLDGVDDEFTFTFRALTTAPTDIKCTATDGDNVDTELTYTTDYTAAINANGIGGTVTLVDAAAVGTGTLTVYRETTNKQESDYDDYNQFPADTVENDFDIRTLISQEQGEANDRLLQLPLSYSGTASTVLPLPVADKVLGWNSAANAIENKTFTPSTDLELASQADAEAGTNNTKYMSPLRVQQAIDDIDTLTVTTLTIRASAVAGVAPNAGAPAIIEKNDDVYLQLLTPNDKQSGLLFGDPEDDNVGVLVYQHTGNIMLFQTGLAGTAATTKLELNDTSGDTGGSGGTGTNESYVELKIKGVRYKLKHDGTI